MPLLFGEETEPGLPDLLTLSTCTRTTCKQNTLTRARVKRHWSETFECVFDREDLASSFGTSVTGHLDGFADRRVDSRYRRGTPGFGAITCTPRPSKNPCVVDLLGNPLPPTSPLFLIRPFCCTAAPGPRFSHRETHSRFVTLAWTPLENEPCTPFRRHGVCIRRPSGRLVS